MARVLYSWCDLSVTSCTKGYSNLHNKLLVMLCYLLYFDMAIRSWLVVVWEFD